MIVNQQIKYMNSFGLLLSEGLILTEYNRKVLIDYNSIKRIQLLKKKKDILNKYHVLLCLIVLIISGVMYITSNFSMYYFFLFFLSLTLLIVSFFYKKQEYYFTIFYSSKHIKFRVSLSHKEDAKIIVHKVLDIIDQPEQKK